MTETEKMQWMANGIILTCSILINNSFCGNVYNTIEAISTIFSETGITKEEWVSCEDEFSKREIVELFDNDKSFYKKMGWIE